ncbi:alpha/beta fold hydrolase [Azospirillum sp. sgz301742]
MPEMAETVVVHADDGQPIPLWRAGHGRPLILLHEWAADHTAWDRFIPTLAKSFTVYAWDARGHGTAGASHAPQAGPPIIERMAHDLKQAVDRLALEAPLLARIIHQRFGTAPRRRGDRWRQRRGMTGLEGCGDRFVRGHVAPAITAAA